MRATAYLLALSFASACASNVTSKGYVATDRDPTSGEGRVVMGDVEAGGLALSGFSAEDHAGALLDISASHDVVKWMSCTEVTLVAAGEAIDSPAVHHDLDSENSPITMVTHYERISIILDDAQLSWLVERGQHGLEVRVCDTVHKVGGAPLATLRSFAASALAAHDGREGLPQMVVPSDSE